MKGRAAYYKAQGERDLALAWQIGGFVGLAFGGNLKALDEYLPRPKVQLSQVELIARWDAAAAANPAIRRVH